MEKKVIRQVASLGRLLTPQRLRYPYLIGAALWLGWLLSLAAGSWSGKSTDNFGQLVGADYSAFYTAGKILLEGKADQLYHPALAVQVQKELYGGETAQFNPYLNPPFYAFLFVPLALLPYPASPILWMLLNLACFALALHWLSPGSLLKKCLLALTWMPAWAAISFGQNTGMSLLLLSGVYVFWRKDRRLLAGLVCGLLLYKPQLVFGVALLWLLEWRTNWRALAGLAFSAAGLAALSFILLPGASAQYIGYAQILSSQLLFSPVFPIWNAHGVQSFWIGLFPQLPGLAGGLYYFSAAFVLIAFLNFWRHNRSSQPLGWRDRQQSPPVRHPAGGGRPSAPHPRPGPQRLFARAAAARDGAGR